MIFVYGETTNMYLCIIFIINALYKQWTVFSEAHLYNKLIFSHTVAFYNDIQALYTT